jgi:hypothetical protein
MSILGKVLASTASTHVYTCPVNKRAVASITATNIDRIDAEVSATLSIRKASEINNGYKINEINIVKGGDNYAAIPTLAVDAATGPSASNGAANVIKIGVASFVFADPGIDYVVSDILTLAPTPNGAEEVELSIGVDSVDGTGGILTFTILDNAYIATIASNLSFNDGTGTTATIDYTSILYSI